MNGHHEKLGQNPRSWSKPRDSIPSNGQASPNGKITLNPHVAHMWITCVHMCPTCVVPSSHFYPHVVKNFHMWNTCEVEQTHVYIVCLACDTQEPTCDYMWWCEACVGSYLLTLRSHVERTCEIGISHKIHMWISCDFSVRVHAARGRYCSIVSIHVMRQWLRLSSNALRKLIEIRGGRAQWGSFSINYFWWKDSNTTVILLKSQCIRY